MAGLLGDVLPWAYSQGDRLKRNLNGLLGDPMGTFTQAVNDANDRAGGLLAQTGAAAQERGFGPATQALGQTIAAGYSPAGMTVWHGSPHSFNAFDASKIGTGEGAQVYGHGLYLAESPDVAKQYADNVKDMGAVKDINSELSRMSKIMSSDEIGYRSYRSDVGRNAAAQYDALMAQREAVRKAPGNLYKVDLPDPAIAQMLDYDNPVPEPVRQRVSAAAMQQFGSGATGTSGQHLYSELFNEFKRAGSQSPQADAAQFLRAQGIPGMRYLDGASRDGGAGTSNFVVFPGNEGLLQILERNGAPIQN